MQDILARLGSDDLMALFMVLSFAVVGLAMFSVAQWRKMRQTELETGLKQDMLNRGFSAEQIKCVLEASGTRQSSEEEIKPSATDRSRQHDEKVETSAKPGSDRAEDIVAAARRLEALARNHAREALKKVAERL